MSTTEQYATAWRPFVGDALQGEVVSIDWRENEHGRYQIATIEVRTGEHVAIHAFGKILREAVAGWTVGDIVKVTYRGRIKGGKFSYHKYEVERTEVAS